MFDMKFCYDMSRTEKLFLLLDTKKICLGIKEVNSSYISTSTRTIFVLVKWRNVKYFPVNRACLCLFMKYSVYIG